VPKAQKKSGPAGDTSATVGYEAQLWQMADALRGSMDAAEYKHVCLGLLFLKYISDAFEISDWGGERLRDDKRWQYGVPPAGNANFAWVQHIVHHLAPAGVAGFVLANGSMSSNQSGEGEIRKSLIEADLVDCMVALPGQLFYSTQIPACLWFLARDRKNGKFRDRRGHVLFIDARKLGRMVDRTHRELTDEDVARIADTNHAWRGETEAGKYADVPGFCKSAPLDEVRKHGHVLTPGRYVGAEAQEDDGEPFEEKMKRLTATLCEQQAEATRLDAAIADNLRELGVWRLRNGRRRSRRSLWHKPGAHWVERGPMAMPCSPLHRRSPRCRAATATHWAS